MIAVILFALLVASMGLVGIVLPQTTTTKPRGYEGQLVETDARNSPKTGIAEGATRFGIAVFRGTAGLQVRPPAAADYVALDADGIHTALACTAADRHFYAADADGAGGAGPWPVSRFLTVTRSAHADADAITYLFTYIADDGKVVTNEPHVAANGGGDTLTSDRPAIAMVDIFEPAQQAGGGSTTSIGWAGLGSAHALGIVQRDEALDPATDGVLPDGASLSYLDEGTIFCLPEDAVEKDQQVFVRIAAAGAGETFGRLGPDHDGADCLPLWGATWGEAGDENDVVPVVLSK